MSRATPPSRNDESRMDTLVTIAARLFAEKGFAETGVTDLTDAMGLQRGGLYHYIRSKEDLLFAIHERSTTPLLKQVLDIESRGDPPETTLRLLARAMLADIEQFRNEVIVVFSEWRKINDDPRWEGVRQDRREIEAVFDRTMARGEEEGTFAFKDRRASLLGFLGMLNYSHQWFRPGGRMGADQIADLFTDIFLQGVATQ